MEETKNTSAIILRNLPFRERDSQIEIYSKDFGRLSLIARGTKTLKSKMRGHIEPITFVRVMIVKGKKLDYLGAVLTENAFLKIREDYDKVLLAGRILKLYLDCIKQNEPQEDLFNLLFSFFEFLNKNKINDYNLFYSFFMLKFLNLTGFKPELNTYLDSKKRIVEKKHCFDLAGGGLVEEKKSRYCLNISVDTIKTLRLALKEDFSELIKLKTDSATSKEVTKIIGSFFNYNLSY